MLSKKEIKDIQSLSHKKYRTALNLFLAEGPKIVGELIERVPGHIKKLYATSGWIQKNAGRGEQFDLVEISDVELQRISQQQTPHEVIALVEQFETTEPSSSFVLY